jgi:Xaa-Pro aminopeptidase
MSTDWAPSTRIEPFTRSDYEARVARLQRNLAVAGLDGAFYTERASFEYLTGVSLPPLWSSYTRLLAVVVPASGKPTLLLPSFVANEAAPTGWPIEAYDSLEQGGSELLAGALGAAGLRSGRVGFERGRESRLATTYGDLAALADRLPGVDLDDAMEPMWATRSIKDAGEIARLRVACEAAGAGFVAAFAAGREGATERDVATIIQTGGVAGVAGSGAWVELGWIGITSGAGSYDRFVAGPRDRRLERGDMLWADLGFTADGYWSDFCRAAIVGGPTPHQRDRQARIAEATAVGTAMARPGVATADIARAMRAALARLGLPTLGFGRLGHGIGLTATEPPSVVEHDPTILEAGQVITCEPAASLDDGLYCTEQIVVVGETPELLSTFPTELWSI